MTRYTAEQVREARQTWINILINPDTKKETGRLTSGDGERCCLGHACFALGYTEILNINGCNSFRKPSTRILITAYLDKALTNKLGMWSERGRIKNREFIPGTFCKSLATWNDITNVMPQEIGAYLQSVIEGGEGTPFRPLSEFDSNKEGT